MPLSPKKPIVLIRPRSIFQAVFLPHREYIEVVHIQNPAQVGVAGEYDAEKIVFLAFHPIGRWPQGGRGRYMRVVDGEKNLDAETQVVCKTVQVINHTEFFACIVGVVHSTERCEEIGIDSSIFLYKSQQINDLLPGCFKRQHSVRLAVRKNCLRKTALDEGEQGSVGKLHTKVSGFQDFRVSGFLPAFNLETLKP